MVGSEEARVPSALYSEKVYVMARSFLRTALSSPLQGIDDIIRWLYLSSQPEGPHLLRRVVEDSKALLPDARIGSSNNLLINGHNAGITEPAKISTGALILLRKNLDWLSEYLSQNEEKV